VFFILLYLYKLCACFSDKLSRACKIRDEYGLVKDLVQDRERKRLAVASVTAPYGDGSGARKGISFHFKIASLFVLHDVSD